jgi:16S rRNA G966 N2-methylase RsmD
LNKLILNTGVQDYIDKNLASDILAVLLSKPCFEGISQKELAEQIEAKKKCGDKLPTWFEKSEIYYPNKLHVEQTSSEITARYKAQLVSGKSLIDLTGGLGVDAYFFAQQVPKVFHCEIKRELSEIAAHNFKVLEQEHIACLAVDGISFLQESNQNFDWIFIDPSRRDDAKGKVFLLEDCHPDVSKFLPLFFEKAAHLLIKTSPLLDIKQAMETLESVKEIHVVAVQNEVKELLFVLEKGYDGKVAIKTRNIRPDRTESFDFIWKDEGMNTIAYEEPSTYLYEPNAAILKSGAFKTIGKEHLLKKLHPHSHLYTSGTLVAFPGRRFKIEHVVPYSKKALKSLEVSKANVTARNFPQSVAELRKKHKIKDGGNRYIFFTKTLNDSLIVVDCTKVED